MLLYYFRVSMVEASAPDSFGSLNDDGQLYNREAWLRVFFSVRRSFVHRGVEFLFVPINADENGLPSSLLFGWIAKAVTLAERTPPSAGFDPIERPSWRGALLILDPREHKDGQKIAFERRRDIGKPASIMTSLAKAMKIEDDPPPFQTQIYTIAAPMSFWAFAEVHGFRIRSLSFEVATPNMFGGKDAFSRELRLLRDRNRVQRVAATLQSETDIGVDEENIREIVEYTERGAGDIKARSESGERYDSREHAARESLDAESDQLEFWKKLRIWLEGRF